MCDATEPVRNGQAGASGLLPPETGQTERPVPVM